MQVKYLELDKANDHLHSDFHAEYERVWEHRAELELKWKMNDVVGYHIIVAWECIYVANAKEVCKIRVNILQDIKTTKTTYRQKNKS